MTPVVQLYWIRAVLGVVAGAVSAVLALYLPLNDLSSLIDSFTIALLIYLVSYYPLKAIYSKKIEKQSKILSTAVLMYFLAWLPFFVLFFTLFKIYA
jgi:membrane protein DedA with SNARE-associated domain